MAGLSPRPAAPAGGGGEGRRIVPGGRGLPAETQAGTYQRQTPAQSPSLSLSSSPTLILLSSSSACVWAGGGGYPQHVKYLDIYRKGCGEAWLATRTGKWRFLRRSFLGTVARDQVCGASWQVPEGFLSWSRHGGRPCRGGAVLSPVPLPRPHRQVLDVE